MLIVFLIVFASPIRKAIKELIKLINNHNYCFLSIAMKREPFLNYYFINGRTE